jgi:hypothetical protein
LAPAGIGNIVTIGGEPERRVPLEPSLSDSQRALLRDFNHKAGRPAIDREFKLVGEPPAWRLERNGMTLTVPSSEQDLLMLARSGYVQYSSEDRTVSFLAKACRGESQPVAVAPLRSSWSRAAHRLRAAFGKGRTLTLIQVCAIAAVVIIAILCLLGMVSAVTAGTLAALGALVVAILQVRQRGSG